MKLGLHVFGFIAGTVLVFPFVVQGFDPGRDFFPDGDTILTEDVEDVINEEVGESDGFNSGIDAVIGEGQIKGIYTEGVEDNATAWEKATRLMRGVINYFLGLVGLVALIYLLYHGFLVLTAGGDEEKAKAGWKGVKYATIALAGIAFAWFLVSIVLFLIFTVTDGASN